MDYLRFIFYGLIQGLTEFIPISSTAHLKVISYFFGIDDPGASLSAIIQLGSVLAIIWYFKFDILSFYKTNTSNFYRSVSSNKLIKSIFIGTLPIIFLGGIIKIFIPDFTDSPLRNNFSIAVVSIIMAFLMFISDNNNNNKLVNIKNHSFINVLIIGIAQSFAIIPGVSRSGITISIAFLLGWKRHDAAKFSFLLGIPAITLAAIVEIFSSIPNFSSFEFLHVLMGLFTAFISSLLAIEFLIKYISRKGLKIFVYYRLIFGSLILLSYL